METTTMPLHEIIKNRIAKEKELEQATKDFERTEKQLSAHISGLKRLETLAGESNDIDKIQIAEKIIYVRGNPHASTESSGGTIAQRAIADITENFAKLRREYFGNKRYGGFYQNSNHSYGMGPTHGSIVDKIGLAREFKDKQDFTDAEKDACIYYLMNYSKIKPQQ